MSIIYCICFSKIFMISSFSKEYLLLIFQALINNPKIQVVDGDKYKFKPKYNIRDKKGLIRLLDKNDQRGLGGIYKEDVEEALPNSQRAFKVIMIEIIY